MGSIRSPAVAGMFYPGEAAQLARDVQALLDDAPHSTTAVPKALIAPHAGYVYSGPIAASVYARLAPARDTIRRVVLIGPSHRVAFRGLAVSSAEAFRTPLGLIPVDRQAVDRLLTVPGVAVLDAAHAQEHSLEVHLPFLQSVLADFALVPLVAGDASAETVAAALEAVWGGPETLVVISSDLSHYLDYGTARQIDARTSQAIEALDAAAIAPQQACGLVPIRGLLTLARRHGLSVETIDLRNSGDTAGPRDQVVGYGAWLFREGEASAGPGRGDAGAGSDIALFQAHKGLLLSIARAAIAARLTGERPAIPAPLPDFLGQPGAAFVTLHRQGQLRGCIGSPEAWRPLLTDIADNAVKAAFADPRFPPLEADELADLDLSVSLLSAPQPMTVRDEADLLHQLRPGIDGLIIEDGGHRALFLPAVWKTLPQPALFLAELKRKAGLPAGAWSPRFTARRFEAVELESD